MPAAPEIWCLTPGADLAVHCWGDECLVHHGLSNDTHRLSRWAADLLRTLGQGSMSCAALARHQDMDPTDVDEALKTLAGLDLVQRAQ